ncbi:DUF5050 domain-containing protein [Sporosarcina sp. FSL K6-1508]|uniref:DUF5050 domain-containing protein n=1 Tax=Sporosarcina sp. FSL K6-1508 TaxID=2921553 RepID=UPI0030F93C4F
MKKTLAIISTFLVTLLLFSGLSAPVQADTLTIVDNELVERIQAASIRATSKPNSYEMVRSALLAGQTTGYFETSEMAYTDVPGLINKITSENPEIMYLTAYKYWSNGKIEFTYSQSTITIQNNKNALVKKVDEVLASIIKPEFTDFDKVKAIHDYLVLTTAYDEYNYDNNTVPADSYAAYGSLVKDIAVCDGYTKAAQLLMNRLGIENQYVDGTANGELHSWNLVKLDGKVYFMDITWDDPTPDKLGYVRYAYFLITSDQLRKDHVWNETNWPVATSVKYSYFNEFDKTIEVDGIYYFSNNGDHNKLYKITKEGTNKQKINDVRAPYFAIAGDWIYFSNYNNSGYLSKMNKNGTELEQLNSVHSTDITVKGNTLTYLNTITNKRESLIVDIHAPNIVTPIGDIVPSNKMWTVTFNQKFEFSSIKEDTVAVKTDNGISIQVTYEIDPTGTKLLVYPPKGGYEKNTNYVLTIENVKSPDGKVQKKKEIHPFYVR